MYFAGEISNFILLQLNFYEIMSLRRVQSLKRKKLYLDYTI